MRPQVRMHLEPVKFQHPHRRAELEAPPAVDRYAERKNRVLCAGIWPRYATRQPHRWWPVGYGQLCLRCSKYEAGQRV